MMWRKASADDNFPERGLSRRSFLKCAIGTVLGGAFLNAPGAVGGLASTLARDALDFPKTLRKCEFLDHLNETFVVHTGPLDRLHIILKQVSDINTAGANPPMETFSTIFHGPPNVSLPQGTYNIEHKALGLSPIFIVPVYSDDDNIHYEAIFNRLGT